jgi:glyoxylase-like metal-dependent hydrolase (beta-lactamase superfamily II)
MRALAVHADVIVFVSAIWQTTCTAIRSGKEGFVIDSPVLPEELEALPGVLAQAGFPISGLLCTHADWDHLLARTVLDGIPLGCGEPTAACLASEPGAAQRALKAFDAEHYIAGRAPLRLTDVQELPLPGRVTLGSDEHEQELELHPAPGHTTDGTAYWIPWAAVLACGDYLSPVEIPMISKGGSAEMYLETLARLETLLADALTMIPGHGPPLEREDALRVLAEDRAYLIALQRDGAGAPLPPGRRSTAQRQIHERNVRVAAAGRG